MNKVIIGVLFTLGVMGICEGKPQKYRLESWVYRGTTYYLPQKRVWARTNYFPLPFKVWQSGSFPFTNKSSAEAIIDNWKRDEEDRKRFKSIYISVE